MNNNNSLQRELEDLKRTLKKKDKEMQKKDKEIKDLQRKSALKGQKSQIIIDLNMELGPLRAHFTNDCMRVCRILQILYEASKDMQINRTFIRRSYQLAILGIVWTEALKIESVSQTYHPCIRSTEIFENGNCWEKIDEKTRWSIVNWINNFYNCDKVKPEALISQNLWAFILRSIIMSIESQCRDHSEENRLQCFGEYSTKHLARLNNTFYTDFVYLSGCGGLPLFMVEISAEQEIVHKDLKKLALQLSSVLLQQIGIFKAKFGAEASELIGRLRVFGALISGPQIEFCVCRPVMGSLGKFHFHLETQSDKWTQNIFDEPIVEVDESIGKLSEITVEDSDDESESRFQEVNYIEIEEHFMKHQDSKSRTCSSRKNGQFGMANQKALESITQFIVQIHGYYQSMNDVEIKPDVHDHDMTMSYPRVVHEEFCTTGSATPEMKQARFEKTQQGLEYRVRIDCPTDFIFPTLPSFLYIREDQDDDMYRFDLYSEGISFEKMNQLIEENSSNLVIGQVHAQSAMILNIIMGLYEAFQAGFIFTKFEMNDICFHNGLYCIKTYTNARPINSSESLIGSVIAFFRVLFSIYYWQNAMTEGDEEFRFLQLLRRTFLEAKTTNDKSIDWKELFISARQVYQEMLYDYNIRNDLTATLLDRFIENIDQERKRSVFRKRSSFLNSSGSSVETMPISSSEADELGKVTTSDSTSTELTSSDDQIQA